MQDQIIKGTGNSRFLKSSIPENITFEQFVSLLRAGTFPMDFNGLNDAGIEQLGTPINKSTLLKDQTSKALGFPTTDFADVTPNDAFRALTLLTGATDPTTATAGAIGQCYWNSTDKTLFKCVEINNTAYVWEQITGKTYTEIVTGTVSVEMPSSGETYILTSALGVAPEAIIIYGKNQHQPKQNYSVYGIAVSGSGYLHQTAPTKVYYGTSTVGITSERITFCDGGSSGSAGALGDGEYTYVAWIKEKK